MTGPIVEHGEVQGNILRAYEREFDTALYVFLSAEGAAAATVVRHWLERVSFGRRPKAHPDPWLPHLNIAFTYGGLATLGGVPDALLADFPAEYMNGARAQAASLGDLWQKGDGTFSLEDADVLLTIHGVSVASCEALWEELAEVNACRGSPLREVHVRDAEEDRESREYRRERFGFADGLSQPAIEGVDRDPVGDGVYAGQQSPEAWLSRRLGFTRADLGIGQIPRSWRPIRTGEFLLGYENEDAELPEGPPAPLGPNGTFMVYREIDQHPEVFNAYVEQWAPRHQLSEEELGAKIVGRWSDGMPAGHRPPDPPQVAQARRRANDFLYADDRAGFGCPLGAHVRRANPRDSLPGGGERTMRHRIIRRGMPYTKASRYHPDREGLAFVCFSASIANGFEFIQRTWINAGETFGLGPGPDFLLQQPDGDGRLTGTLVVPGYSPRVLPPPEAPFVTVRDCEYFFVPSRRACAWLADRWRDRDAA